MRYPLLILVLFGLGACRAERLHQAKAELAVEPAEVDLGRMFLGHPRAFTVKLHNLGAAPLTLSIETDGPITAAAEVSVGSGETKTISVTASPSAKGALDASLSFSDDDGVQLVPVRADVVPEPVCEAPDGCHLSSFDADAGACVVREADDGVACAGNGCIINGACLRGACVGEAKACDDGNACTLDACVPGKGCVSIDSASSCAQPPLDSCLVGYCDPATGCGTTGAFDGASCGSSDCVSSHVCIAGACVERPTPEGAACGTDSPCSSPGACHAGACDQAAPGDLTPAWSYQPPIDGTIALFGALDEQQNVYWTEVASTPSLVSVSHAGAVRFRTPLSTLGQWTDQLLIASGKAVVALSPGKLVAVNTTDGAVEWEADLGSLLGPDLPGANAPFYLYVESLGTDRQGRIFALVQSSVPATPVGLTMPWFLVAIDANDGTMKWRRQMDAAQGMVIDAFGSVHTLEQSGAGWSLVTTGPDGAMSSSSSMSQYSQLLSTGGDAIALSSGEIVSLAGATRANLPDVLSNRDPLFAFGSIIYASNPPLAPFVTESITHANALTGSVDWTLGFGPLIYGNATQPLVAADGSTISVRPGATAGTVQSFSAYGDTRFTCGLENAQQPDHALLGEERLYVASVHQYERCEYAGPDDALWAPQSVLAYDLPKVSAATSGWVGEAGAADRARRPR